MRRFIFSIVFASLVVASCAIVSAQDSDFTVEESRSLAVVPEDGVRRALLISTGRHFNKKITPLAGVDSDVDLIRERLLDPRCGFQDENVVVLKTDDYPTLENIDAALDEFLESCGSNDFAFLYLGGHGARDPQTEVDYYVPLDAKPIIENGQVVAFDGSTCFSLKTLKEKIEGCAAKFKWVIVDACRENLEAKGASDEWNSIGKLEAAEGSIWFQSCETGRKSYETTFFLDGEFVKHGIFAWYFCQGAEGAAANSAGLISPIRLFEYVRNKTREARNKDRKIPEQVPLMSCQDLSDGEFVFVDASDSKEIDENKLYDVALQFFLNREYSQALTQIDEALKLRPENSTYQGLRKTIVDSIVQELLTRGWRDYAEEKNDEASSRADSALELDPTNQDALKLKEYATILPQDPAKPLPIDYFDSNGAEYRLIQAGSFMMGSPLTGEEVVEKYQVSLEQVLLEAKWFNAPQHNVALTRDFYLAKRPVTKGEFQRFVEATGYKTTAEEKGGAFVLSTEKGYFLELVKGASWMEPGFEQTESHPVVCVSYYDALAYIAWLNENSEASSELYELKPFYRLPTDAEWEYACRAGAKTEFFWGDDEKDGKGYANVAGEEMRPKGESWNDSFSFDDGFSATSPVGSFKPNSWGLYDMLGEVFEWTSDLYYPDGIVTDPDGATNGSWRVLRGGSWCGFPVYCRCVYRRPATPEWQDVNSGFRVAFSLTSK